MKNLVYSFDDRVAKIIGRLPSTLHGPFHYLGIIAMPVVWCALLAFLIGIDIIPDDLRKSAIVVIIFIPVASIIKSFFRRERPPTIYAKAMRIKTKSFPSSHAYASMLAGGFLVYTLLASHHVITGIVLIILVMIVGLSRVHLGAHYPSDVVAGWLLALIVLSGVILM